jgi:beta-mannosidase
MKSTRDLSTASWTLAGYTPDTWPALIGVDTAVKVSSEVPPMSAWVPASVQQILLEHDVIPDWTRNLDSRASEWVENRNWVFSAHLPRAWFAGGAIRRLRCAGLDHAGWVSLNGRLAGHFENGFIEHVFDLSALPLADDNLLQIIFDIPPRWLGQFNYTSRIKDWKARFNYTWDWLPRVVQIGVWDRISLEVSDGRELEGVRCQVGPDGFTLFGSSPARVEVLLEDGDRCLLREWVEPARLASGAAFAGLPVEPWWPSGEGPQKTYRLVCRLPGASGSPEDEWHRTVGFKSVAWRPCAGAPADADSWICVVNGKPLFLQGVNWTPIRPNYADLVQSDYESRIRTYADLGCNLFRVWGGAFLETETFYDLCDRHGIMIWQEFPFSSSGIDNWPPEDPKVIDEARPIIRSYITRRQHHASLLLWCGGNELQGSADGGKVGSGKPTPTDHPLLRMMAAEAASLDPGRRFLHTSASGPSELGVESQYGKGLHWDVHGPWLPESEEYWRKDDSLFRSEVGAPGASPMSILEKYFAPDSLLPADESNPLWSRFWFWIQAEGYVKEHGHPPTDLASYVAWTQRLQAEALSRAARSCRGRFPACGGIIIWMGHDSFPCPNNTAILDFHGHPKPAALALKEIFLYR